MEPISVRKLDNFYGKDRRIINTGLLSSENGVPEETINQLTYAKNYSRRSLLNYDGNSLFAGYGSSFYNPFFNKVFLNSTGAPYSQSQYYGYLHKTSRDIITLPVYSPLNSITGANELYDASEFNNNLNIWSNYVGKDVTMRYNGLILRSDGHYIMNPIDGVSEDLDARLYTKENNSSVFYYVPFFAPDMYDRSNGKRPFNECPEGYTNIIIGPPDIFTIGQTYYALLDFEPYINNTNNTIYTVIRMATSQLLTCDDTPIQNRTNTWDYVNSCAYVNIESGIQSNQTMYGVHNRKIDIVPRIPDDVNNDRNTLMCIKASYNVVLGDDPFAYRQSLALLLEWRWGLRNSPFSVAKEIEEKLSGVDALSTGIFSEGMDRRTYYCPFLEISARPVLGMDFTGCNHLSDYENVDDISNLFY